MRPPRASQGRFRRLLRLLLLWAGGAFLLAGAGVALAELWTWSLSHQRCEPSVERLPEKNVGLVLGCSPRMSRGRANSYFTGRMDAAEALWKSGKVRGLIVSGDNSSPYYNEPRAMKEELARRGVPPERIVCDYAGVCTYDSVARHLQMDAAGMEAPLAPLNRASTLRQYLRERGARLAMVYDFLTRRTPRHLGSPEPLPF